MYKWLKDQVMPSKLRQGVSIVDDRNVVQIDVDNPNYHIYEFLNYYAHLPHAPSYAVMLSGEWGIGKTYLIKKVMTGLEHEDVKSIYVSLYGLTSSDQIADAIFRSIYPLLDKKGVAIAGAVGKAVMKYVNISPDFKSDDFLSHSNERLYIFDDLERTSMPLPEALGYINALVEHDACKVVVISNEKVLLDDEANGYQIVKEKLFGRTLVVKSSFHDALEYFVSNIPSNGAKEWCSQNIDLIGDVFLSSDSQNLRVLQQSLWDLGRFFDLLQDAHLEKKQAVEKLFSIFLALSLDYKLGRLSEDDLKSDVMKASWGYAFNKDREPTPMEQTAKRYSDVFAITEQLLSSEVVVQTIAHGLFDSIDVCKCLDASRLFKPEAPEDAWVTIWYKWERTDEEFDTALEVFQTQFSERHFNKVGELLHVFGLMIFLSKNSFVDMEEGHIIRECRLYIDDLVEAEKLEPYPLNPFVEDFSHGAWGGLGFYERDSAEFTEIADYLKTKRQLLQRQSYKRLGYDLLQVMKSDPTQFLRQVVSGASSAEYASVPLLTAVSPVDFIDVFLSMSPSGRNTVVGALKSRYEHVGEHHKLYDELEWLHEVVCCLTSKSSELPRLVKMQVLELHIPQLNSVLPPKTPDCVAS
jgi:hypothetical protein